MKSAGVVPANVTVTAVVNAVLFGALACNVNVVLLINTGSIVSPVEFIAPLSILSNSSNVKVLSP